MINGAIALQVIVGAITTGVAAGSKNVTPPPPIPSKYSSFFDIMVDRLGPLLLF